MMTAAFLGIVRGMVMVSQSVIVQFADGDEACSQTKCLIHSISYDVLGCGLHLADAGFDRSEWLRLKAFLCGSVHHFILFDSNMDWSPVQANGLSLLGELYAVQNRCDESNIVKEDCFVMHELLYVNQ